MLLFVGDCGCSLFVVVCYCLLCVSFCFVCCVLCGIRCMRFAVIVVPGRVSLCLFVRVVVR